MWYLGIEIQMRTATIEWNGFLELCVRNFPHESCAFNYTTGPYYEPEIWHILPVKNVAKEKEMNWEPDRKELKVVRERAKKNMWMKIGNIHTHPFVEGFDVQEQVMPSKVDLTWARKSNDMVRGIIVVSAEAIMAIRFHDQFNREIPFAIEEDTVTISGPPL